MCYMTSFQVQANPALYEAVMAGDVQGVEAQLALGANPNMLLADGNTLLHHAVKQGNPDVVSSLLKKAPRKKLRRIRRLEPEEWTRALQAIGNMGLGVIGGAIYLSRYFPESPHEGGAIANAVNDAGETPLRLAILGGHTKIARMLGEADGGLGITELDFSGQQRPLVANFLEALAVAIPFLPQLLVLNLSGINISNVQDHYYPLVVGQAPSFGSLVEALNAARLKLIVFNLNGSDLEHSHIQALSPFLCSNHNSLKAVDLGENYSLGSTGIRALAQIFDHCGVTWPNLTELSLSNIHMTTEDLPALRTLLSYTPALQILSLSYNDLSGGFELLAEALGTLTNLQTVDFGHTLNYRLSDEGAQAEEALAILLSRQARRHGVRLRVGL